MPVFLLPRLRQADLALHPPRWQPPPPPGPAPGAVERTWQEDLAIAIRDGFEECAWPPGGRCPLGDHQESANAAMSSLGLRRGYARHSGSSSPASHPATALRRGSSTATSPRAGRRSVGTAAVGDGNERQIERDHDRDPSGAFDAALGGRGRVPRKPARLAAPEPFDRAVGFALDATVLPAGDLDLALVRVKHQAVTTTPTLCADLPILERDPVRLEDDLDRRELPLENHERGGVRGLWLVEQHRKPQARCPVLDQVKRGGTAADRAGAARHGTRRPRAGSFSVTETSSGLSSWATSHA